MGSQRWHPPAGTILLWLRVRAPWWHFWGGYHHPKQMSPASCSPSFAAPCASLLFSSLTQMCQNRPSCHQQKACATVIPVAGGTCRTEPGKAGASAASTVTSSSKKGKGRGVCSMQSHLHPSVCPPSPSPRAPARDASASVSGRCWGPHLFPSFL